MPSKLHSKPCTSCGRPIYGIKRPDRNAYRYPKRCKKCGRKWLPHSIVKLKKTMSERELLPLGTIRMHTSGPDLIYWQVKIANPNKWEYEHRYLMAKKLNRPLKRNEHVHHKNHNTFDNSLDNLELMTSAEHTKEHLGLRGRWSILHPACVECKTTSRPHVAKGRCGACYQRQQKHL